MTDTSIEKLAEGLNTRSGAPLKFVVSVYGQTGYLDSERFNQSNRKIFPLLNKFGEKINAGEDSYELVHRGNLTDDYELVGDYVLVYTPTYSIWEAYIRTTSFPARCVASAGTLAELKSKVLMRSAY